MSDLIRREEAIKALCSYMDGDKTLGQCIDECPTVCDIEQIRDEIERATIEMDYDTAKEALDIIDKYTKGDMDV